MALKGQNFIWQDRKRYFGLPLSFTRYAISEDRLYLSEGLFTLSDDEILLYRVRDISTKRTLWQRMFGVGTVVVISSDKTLPTLELKNIKDPMKVKELLHEQVEEMKIQRRVRVGEILDSSREEQDLDMDDDTDSEDMT